MSLAVQQLRKSLFEHAYKPVPVHTGHKRPWGDDWNTRALQQTAQEAAQWPDSAALNTGLLCAEGLFALDFDVDAPEHVKALEELAFHALGYAPIRRREGTAHSLLLYRMESGASPHSTKMGSKGAMVEVRGAGTQVVGWGHFEGHAYSWTEDLSRRPVTLLSPVTEDGLRAFLEAAAAVLGCEAPSERKKPATGQQDAKAGRSVTAAERTYAAKALAEEAAKLASSKTGRNDALNTASHSVGTMVGAGWLGREEAASALWEAAAENGYRSKDGDAEARKTLLSGLEAGEAKPREPLLILEVPANLAAIKPKQAALGAKRNVTLTDASTIQQEPITWLWPSYLPRGKFVLLAGSAGVGKSTLAFGMAATVTTGGQWPDGASAGMPGNALIWSSEDDAADTIVPRLAAAGADLKRCRIIAGVTDDKGECHPFDPASDILALRDAARAIGGLSLLIVDPVVSAIAGDMHKANDVRRGLQALVDFAAEMDCAVLGITHFAKNTTGRNTAERVIGSQGFGALARVVLVAAKEEDSAQCVFTRAKSNISVDTGGFHYTIEPMVCGPIVATRIAWGEPVEGTAREILQAVEKEDQPARGGRMVEVKDFLRQQLQRGPKGQKELLEAAEGHGIATITLRRAAKELGIVSRRFGFQGQVSWELPNGLGAIFNLDHYGEGSKLQ